LLKRRIQRSPDAACLSPGDRGHERPAFRQRPQAGHSFANQRQVTTEKLEAAICAVVNAYNQFLLPRYWGDTKRAAADGTQWNLYENNLLSERHIRYGGYGGIAYCHVGDDYIALLSHFIPCGVWEAVYILDGDLRTSPASGPTRCMAILRRKARRFTRWRIGWASSSCRASATGKT